MRVKEYIIRLFGQEDNNMYLVHWNSICIVSITCILVNLKNHLVRSNGIPRSQIEVCDHCGRWILRGWISQLDGWTW